MAAKKGSSRKTAASRAAAETSATDTTDTPTRTARAGAKRGAGENATVTTPGPLARSRREPFVRATAAEFEDVRAGRAKADNRMPGPRPRALGTPIGAAAPTDERPKSPFAEVVDITAASQKRKGFRVETVVATRMGHYGLKRRRAGEVFDIGLVGDGYLPSWVRPANQEDQDPEVSRSRQVTRNSTGQEIRDDVEEDAGTKVPTYLGGTQRRPTDQSGDVL